MSATAAAENKAETFRENTDGNKDSARHRSGQEQKQDAQPGKEQGHGKHRPPATASGYNSRIPHEYTSSDFTAAVSYNLVIQSGIIFYKGNTQDKNHGIYLNNRIISYLTDG
ncbi:hypothetical protein DJ030_06505 [bacterium endosymbiont of Escarpia laminata]|nr:MAG: hypothetical protein DJ030_06505 [bacterium endosymbiont of Escarpia laminata]